MPGEGFKIASAFVEVVPDLSGFREKLQSGLEAATAGTDGKVTIGLDDSRLLAALEDIRVQVGEVTEATHDVRLTLEDGDTTEVLEDIKLKLDEVGDKDVHARVDVDTGDSTEKLAALDEELRSKPGDANAASSSMSHFSAMLYLVAAAVPVVAAALPALGGAIAGLGGTLGAAGLAFGGIEQTLSDYMSAQKSAAQSTGQTASTAFSNALAIKQAQQAISDAQKQATQDALTSQQSIISAQQQVGQSEHSYTDALYNEQQAQIALTQARLQARLQLQQLNNAEINGRLNVRSAQLALEQAQQNQEQTDANALSTQLQRQQAALAVAQAERQLIEARQSEKNATDAANKANKEGIAGNPQVLQAQHALQEASYEVRQARQAEANAERQLRMAREQAAFQAQKDAEAVRQAQQNLTNTEHQQQLQTQASGSAMNKFAQDMAKLTVPQRALVRDFMSFNGVLKGLEATAGKAILPGVTVFVRGLHAILPEVNEAVRRFGGVFSQIMGDLGKALQSSSFQRGLRSIISEGVTFMRDLRPIGGMFRDLFDLWAKGGPASDGLGKAIGAIARGFGDLFKNLQPAIKPAGEVLKVLGEAIGDLGGPLGTAFSGLLSALGPTMQALLPGFKALADALGRGLGIALRGLTPLLVPLARAISTVVIALAPMLPQVATMTAQFARGLAPVLTAFLPVVRQLGELLLVSLQNGLMQTMQVSLQLLPPLANLVISFEPLISIVIRAATWVVEFATRINGPVISAITAAVGAVIDFAAKWQTAWHAIENAALAVYRDVFQPLWNDWIKPAFDAIETGVGFLWHNVFQPFWSNVTSGFATMVHGIGTVWSRLEGVFKTPVNFLIKTVYDNGIRRFWDDVVNAVGLKSLDLPAISGLAAGGIVPGQDRGVDERLMWMRPGEGVLVPGAAAALGHSTIHAMNRAYGGGGANEPGHYKQGGIIGNLGGFLGGIGHFFSKAFDMGRIIAALSTGNTTAFTNALGAIIGHGKTPAGGDLAKVMTAMPVRLMDAAAKQLVGMVAQSGGSGNMGTGTQGGLGGSATGTALVKFAEQFIGRVPYVFGGTTTSGWDCSGFTEFVYDHFGFRPPRTSEEQWTWVQRTAKPVLGGLAFFTGSPQDPPPGHVGIITGTDQMVDAYATGFGTRFNSIFGSSGHVWGYGVPPGGGLEGRTFDSGGWLPPWGAVNRTGQPEAVLTPAESQAFVALVKRMTGSGQGAGVSPTVNQYFVGGGFPSAEQKAALAREMAMALGG